MGKTKSLVFILALKYMDVIFLGNTSVCYVLDYTLKVQKLKEILQCSQRVFLHVVASDDRYGTILKDTFHRMECRLL